MQHGDTNIKRLIEILQTPGKRTKDEDHAVATYKLNQGILHRYYMDMLLLVISKTMREGIVIVAHDYDGNFATDRTIARITRDYWFSQIKLYVR